MKQRIETRGSRALDAASGRGWTQAKIADTLGVRAPTVHAWVHGYARPSARKGHVAALERVLGIHPDWWLTTTEKRERTRAARKEAA
jgi:transcriptional regulator with XRE-family HTH domain